MTANLVAACLDLGKPVFGICRGLQELNVAFGGTLRRDMGRSAALLPHHAPADAAWEGMFAHGHDVALAERGGLNTATGKRHLWVNSVHYQGLARLGAGLRVGPVAPTGARQDVSARGTGGRLLDGT